MPLMQATFRRAQPTVHRQSKESSIPCVCWARTSKIMCSSNSLMVREESHFATAMIWMQVSARWPQRPKGITCSATRLRI